jgi:hypothetical protein
LLAAEKRATGHRNQATVTAPAQASELIDLLHTSGHTLTYDPRHRTLRADIEDAVAVTVVSSR